MLEEQADSVVRNWRKCKCRITIYHNYNKNHFMQIAELSSLIAALVRNYFSLKTLSPTYSHGRRGVTYGQTPCNFDLCDFIVPSLKMLFALKYII